MQKRCLRFLLLLLLLTLLSTTAFAAHDDMTWETLYNASTFDEPFTDYESVFDKTQELYLFQDFENDLKQLCEQFPELVRLEVAGYSELGRPLYVMVMGSDYAPNRMFVMATTHAREYVGTQLSVLQIEYYLHNYNGTVNGEPVSDLFDRCQFYFLPMHNPDGAMLSMQGLASLDDPVVQLTEEEKTSLREFLLSQVGVMNEICEADNNYHDTDSNPYTDNPRPESPDAFQYWKSNIYGIDLHYSMYTPWMLDVWKTGTWYYSSQESHFTAPSWQNYAGKDITDGISLSAENRALFDYINRIQPNYFVSYHSASNIVQWNYGYGKMENGEALRSAARTISEKCGELLNFSVSSGSNPHIGHPGWFMKNSENYLDTCGYGVTIELASRQYLSGVEGYGDGYVDAPPTKVIQLIDDVTTTAGITRHSLWTTGKYFPMALAQFIMDNRLVEEGEPLVTDPAPEAVTTPDKVITLPKKEAPKLDDNGPAAADVDLSTATIRLDGEALPVDTFLIADYHYFRLRDLAMMMVGTDKEFSVDWIEQTRTIPMVQPGNYIPTGDELKPLVQGGIHHARKAYPTLEFNGSVFAPPAYNIDGYHYYRLRDLAEVLSFDVDWDGVTRTVYIDTTPAQNGGTTVIPGDSYIPTVDTDVAAIFGQNPGKPHEISLTVGGKTLEHVQMFGSFRPALAAQAFVAAADLLPETLDAKLYNSEYQIVRQQAYIGAETPIRFSYQDRSGSTVYGTFTACRYVPVTSVADVPVQMVDLPQTDACSIEAPTLLVGPGEKNSVTLQAYRESISASDIKLSGGYTATLYANSTFGEEVQKVELPIGAVELYICAYHADSGDRAYYTLTLINPALDNDARIWEIPSGGIQRGWTLTEHAGTREDPDILEVRINGTLFGGSSTRKLSAFAETCNPAATHQLYSDANFTQAIESFTLQGGYAGTGFEKDVWLSVTSADGTVTRYTKIEIRSWQEIQTIAGTKPVFLGALDPALAQSSKNPMCLEVTLPSETALTGLVPLPRGNGEFLGKYPNVAYTTYDDNSGESPLVIQNKSVTTDNTVPTGYNAYYQVSVWHEDSTKVFYQIQIKFSDGSTDESDAGVLSPGESGIHRTWTLTEKSGTAADPDLIEIRANAAYFGTTTARSASHLALPKNSNATVEMYANADFTSTPVTSFDLTGSFAGGHAKDMGLKITAPDGQTVRYYKVQIRSYQAISTIAGITPVWLGQENTSSGNAGANPMELYVELSAEQLAQFTVNTYPSMIVDNLRDFAGNAISGDAASEPSWVKQTSYKEDASTGCTGYLKLAVVNGNSRSYYTIWVGSQPYGGEPEENPPVANDLVTKPIGESNLRKSWTLTKANGTANDPDHIEIRCNAAYFGTTTARKITDLAAIQNGASAQLYADAAFTQAVDSFTMDGGTFSGGFLKTVYLKVTADDAVRYYKIDLRSYQDLKSIGGAEPVYGRTEATGTNSASNRMILTVSLPEAVVNSIQVGQYPDVVYLMHNDDHPSAVSTNQGSWRTAAKAVSAGWPVPADGAEGYAGAYKIYVTYGGANCQYLIWVKAA